MLYQKETDQVQLPESFLPKVSNRSDYEPYQPDTNRWFQAMRVICQRHGLPTDKLTRFGNGTDAAFGTNIVFAVGTDLVIKLYPPYYARLFDADRAVAEYLYSKLNITTPKIVAHGTLENWPYLVMSRLQGVYLADVWDTLDHENQLSIIIELAEALAHLHTLPTECLTLLDSDWSAFVANRVKNCVERHRKQGVPETWLQQIPDYLAHAMPLYPQNFSPAIVSGDIHQYHLLVNLEHGRWRLSGLFDFDDARIGFYEYDLAAAGLFLMADRPALLRRFLLIYGYAESELNEQLSHRLMAYTLLHPYRPLNWVREDLAKGTCSTLEESAQVVYPVGTK